MTMLHDSTNMAVQVPKLFQQVQILHKNKILKPVRDPFQTGFDAEYKTQFLAMNWTFFSFQDGTKPTGKEIFRRNTVLLQNTAGDAVKEHPLQSLSVELCGNEEDKILQ